MHQHQTITLTVDIHTVLAYHKYLFMPQGYSLSILGQLPSGGPFPHTGSRVLVSCGVSLVLSGNWSEEGESGGGGLWHLWITLGPGWGCLSEVLPASLGGCHPPFFTSAERSLFPSLCCSHCLRTCNPCTLPLHLSPTLPWPSTWSLCTDITSPICPAVVSWTWRLK